MTAVGSRSRFHRTLLAVLVLAGCERETAERVTETIFRISPATWFEDGFSYYDVSADGTKALYGARFGMRLLDLKNNEDDSVRLAGQLERVLQATFASGGALARAGMRAGAVAWYLDADTGWTMLRLPARAVPRWSADGARIAWYVPGMRAVYVGDPASPDSVLLESEVSGLSWSADGGSLYAMIFHPSGTSSLMRVRAGGSTEVIRAGLDAPSRFNSIAVAAGGSTVYLALASDSLPVDEDRHHPAADRDTDIYALDLETGGLTPVVTTLGDDFYPQLRGNHLYWTHNDMRDAVVAVARAGGDARVLQDDAQIPYWNPNGTQLAFTMGGWRIADWALNLDAFAVNLDSSGQVISNPLNLVVGYHEDFTPAWSPKGDWLAFHSHRSPTAVPDYGSPGSTDDVYLRRVGAPMESEIRLTDFGWEVGMADWSPDGRQLVFDSWDRERPGVGRPWIATIDPVTGRLLRTERLALPAEIEGTLLCSWSPASNEIAVVGYAQRPKQMLWVLRPDGTHAQKLLEFESLTYGGLDWSPDGRELIYSALGPDRRMQLFAVARTGGSPRQLTRDADGLIHPQVSPDNQLIAATRTVRSKELRRMAVR